MPRNCAILNCALLYNNSSPLLHSIWPRLVVLKWIFNPYARKSNIHCIGLLLPRTMNVLIIFSTQNKQLRPLGLARLAGTDDGICICWDCNGLLGGLLPNSLPYPLSLSKSMASTPQNSSLLGDPAIFTAFWTTMNRAHLMILDNMGGYESGSLQPLSFNPKTDNAQTNGLSYSLNWISWFNNATQKFKHARCTAVVPAPSSSFSPFSSWSSLSATHSTSSTNLSNARACALVNLYGGAFHSEICWLLTKNINICCHGCARLLIESSSQYVSNGVYFVWCSSVRIASIRTNTPDLDTVSWLVVATLPIVFQTISSNFSSFSGLLPGFCTKSNKSFLLNPLKYISHPVRCSHGFTSSLSPLLIVFSASCCINSNFALTSRLILSHRLTPSLSWAGACCCTTQKYCEQKPLTKNRWHCTLLHAFSNCSSATFFSARVNPPLLFFPVTFQL